MQPKQNPYKSKGQETMSDEFELPGVIASTFASADSFRGRLVLIEVTAYELQVPNQNEPGKFADRITATVTTVDGGENRVQIFSYKAPTGKYLDGPVYKGVWFSQTRVLEAVAKGRGAGSVGKKTLGTLQTYKPGIPAGPGNPWGLVDPTPEQIQTAKDFLAGRTIAEATAPVGDAGAAAGDPWAK
jgi:hypothetical protein